MAERETIADGKAVLGVELGSTRIKAVLVDADGAVLAGGSHTWENRWQDGYWTYSLEEAQAGVRAAYAALAEEVRTKYGVSLRRLTAFGISGMMHGYLPFDAAGVQLAPFRTWRSTTSEKAAKILSQELGFNIPIRWSVSHLYQAVLDARPEVPRLGYMTTLAGWVHGQLTGERVLGVCEASGMFPIDPATKTYDARMAGRFRELCGIDIAAVFPKVLLAGETAGTLTTEGARWLDPTGTLEPGAQACPPEGDAATGMVATNSTDVGTGNVSVGTSVFAMTVLDRLPSKPYPEIDIVMSPYGMPVAMVHCNNGTSDLDAWVGILGEAAAEMGARVETGTLYERLFRKALTGEADCGGVSVCNFVSSEPIAGADEACPSVTRRTGARFTLANFMRAQLVAVSKTLKLGLDILTEREGVRISQLTGHGGYFKTPGVGEKIMSEVLGVPVVTCATAGEGGAWGIARLAAVSQPRRR